MTPLQLQCLAYIDGYIRDNGGVSPTVTEIGAALNTKSKSSVVGILRALEERGFIRRIRYRARAIEVINAGPVRARRTKTHHYVNFDTHELLTAEEVYRKRRAA